MGAHDAGWDTAPEQIRAAAPPLDLQRMLAQTDIPLFRGLSKHHRRRVARLAELRQHVGSRPIVRAGTRGDAFYVILDGSAEVRTADGSMESLEPGGYFGELALLDGAHRAQRLPQALAPGAGDRPRPAARPGRHRAGLAGEVGPAARCAVASAGR